MADEIEIFLKAKRIKLIHNTQDMIRVDRKHVRKEQLLRLKNGFLRF